MPWLTWRQANLDREYPTALIFTKVCFICSQKTPGFGSNTVSPLEKQTRTCLPGANNIENELCTL